MKVKHPIWLGLGLIGMAGSAYLYFSGAGEIPSTGKDFALQEAGSAALILYALGLIKGDAALAAMAATTGLNLFVDLNS